MKIFKCLQKVEKWKIQQKILTNNCFDSIIIALFLYYLYLQQSYVGFAIELAFLSAYIHMYFLKEFFLHIRINKIFNRYLSLSSYTPSKNGRVSFFKNFQVFIFYERRVNKTFYRESTEIEFVHQNANQTYF